MAGITGRNPYGAYQNPYLPSMNGYQVPGYGWPGMPTVHADIIQIENEAAGENEPVDAGTSQMMITKDESTILIKSVLGNGETTMDIYRKQPKAEKPAEPEYVTRAEFEKRIAEMIRAEQERTWEPGPERTPLRVLKPETAEDDEPEYEAPAPRPVQRTRSTNGGKRR